MLSSRKMGTQEKNEAPSLATWTRIFRRSFLHCLIIKVVHNVGARWERQETGRLPSW